MELPNFVIERITAIKKLTAISEEELKDAYVSIYKDPFIQTDPQFKTDEERHKYSSAVLWARYVARPPVKEYEVIPLGFSPQRMTKTGLMSSLFALVNEDGQVRLKRIVLRDKEVQALKIITPFCKYSVKLGRFSSGDLIADPRTKWENPVSVNLDPIKFLEKIGVKRVSIKDAKENVSKITSSGYVEETDWKIVRGIITRAFRGKREDGTEWACYTIIDANDTGEEFDEQYVKGFTVWIAPELMVMDEESEADFVGTIQLSKKGGEPFMNCYLSLPIIVKKKGGEQ